MSKVVPSMRCIRSHTHDGVLANTGYSMQLLALLVPANCCCLFCCCRSRTANHRARSPNHRLLWISAIPVSLAVAQHGSQREGPGAHRLTTTTRRSLSIRSSSESPLEFFVNASPNHFANCCWSLNSCGSSRFSRLHSSRSSFCRGVPECRCSTCCEACLADTLLLQHQHRHHTFEVVHSLRM